MRFERDELASLKEYQKTMQLRSLAGLIRVGLRAALRLPNLEERRLLRMDEQVTQLRGMATNLNQMAKAANAGKFRMNKRTEDLMAQMYAAISDLTHLLNEYCSAADHRPILPAVNAEKLAEQRRAHRVSPNVKAGSEEGK
jgi:signal transduction histidine kinase